MSERDDTAKGLPVVEASTVYEWTCPKCGINNIARPMPVPLDDEDKQAMQDEHGISPDDPGEWQAVPNVVECRHCEKKYAARIHMQEPFDDE